MSRKIKSNLLLRITILLIICYCSLTLADEKYGGGTGEPNDPYQIWDANDMQAIGADANDWDKHFILMADIDLNSYTGTDFNIIGAGYYESPPTGFPYFVGTPFTGTFDGNGHEILNFTYDYSGDYITGLFGLVEGEQAEIRSLGIRNASVSGERWVGALVGSSSATVRDCYIEQSSVSGSQDVGGLIGKCSGNALVSNCFSSATVSGNYDVGGLIGSVAQGTILACYSDGHVSGTNDFVGGLLGAIYYGELSGCFSNGAVSGRSRVGGLVGESRVAISNSYSMASVSSETSFAGGLVGRNSRVVWYSYSIGSVSNGGGLIGSGGGAFGSYWDIEASGQSTSSGGAGKTTAEMKSSSTYVGWGACGNNGVWILNDSNDYPHLEWETEVDQPLSEQEISDYLSGTGTEDDPYLVYTAEELNIIGLFPCEWDEHFKLMSDIDLSTFGGSSFNIIGYHVYSKRRPFTGVFDGNGHVIANFTYVSMERTIGLFGHISGDESEIRHLGLIEPNVNIEGGVYIGPLVGYLEDGLVASCYVQDGTIVGYKLLGGLVGKNKDGNISKCYSVASVMATDDYVGGIIGSNTGTVSDCYSMGQVTGDTYIGGLVGETREGKIHNSYARGTISGSGYVGGLAGANYATITNSYATGTISGSRRVGGLAGQNHATITNSYWDIETSNESNMCGSPEDPNCDNSYGKTIAEMKQQSTFFDWNFTTTWHICENLSYPRLQWQVLPADLTCPYGVSLLDFSILARAWQSTPPDDNWDSDCDLDGNEHIGAGDLAIACDQWMKE